MSTCLYSKEEFKSIMSPPNCDCSYLCRDIESFWRGEEKLLFVGIEGPCTEEEEFGYRALESIVEGKEIVKRFDSIEGEECYCIYSLDKEDKACIDDVPSLLPIKGKNYLLVEVNIPGMTDYFFFF